VGQVLNEKPDYCGDAKRYARHVVSGKIPACKWVQLACERQLRDLKQKQFGWYFDDKRAAPRICEFIEELPHIKGRWKTPNIQLEAWQRFYLSTIFGWVDADGFRRYRTGLIVVPRKNAKTTCAAGVGLYLLGPDGEPGSEVYSAAVTRDQAKFCWTVAQKMARRLPGFCDRYGIEPLAHSIAIPTEAAFFKPLASDADSLEGLNVQGAIIDELHAHKTREVFDVLDEATGSRRQPLKFVISTEGDNRTGIFAEQVDYLKQVLQGNHKDDSYFGIIYTIDEGDDWTTRPAWIKANPNFGVSIFESDLETRCAQARANPESQASFLTKRLNVRVGAGQTYFNMLAWDRVCKQAGLKIEDFYGKECFIALDLASKIDIAAKIILFPTEPKWVLFGKYYLPEDVVEKGNPNYDFYRGWARQGHITLTPGNITDYEFIEKDLLEDQGNFQVLQVGIDPHNATQFNTRMMKEGVPIVEIPQNVLRLSDPMNDLGARILAGKVRHNGDPVLSWMMGNVTAKKDVKENVYPRKARDENKIDGAVASIMAVRLGLVNQQESSVYDNPETAVI
jgi:phage terminase large subunit-like protein